MLNEKYDDEEILKDIFFKSLELADPAKKLEDIEFDPPLGRLFFVSVGKGAGRLAKAFNKTYREKADGIVVIPENEKCDNLEFEVIRATHPIPSEAGLKASIKLLSETSKLGKDDLLIFCVSGGASALLPLPPEGFGLEDEIFLNKVLLSSGLSIKEMNLYRGVFSQIKGGKLASAAYPCPIINLVVSDIPGGDLSLVGSGPTFVADEERVITRSLDFGHEINGFFEAHKNNSTIDQEEKALVSSSICLGSSALLLDEAQAYIEKNYALNCLVLSSEFEGSASSLAKFHASILKEIKQFDRPIKKPAIIVSSGEAYVKLPKNHGKGGRNSHFALALAKEIEGIPGITVLAADTDGIDGFEQNAGAIISGQTFNIVSEKAPTTDFLKDFDSFTAHKMASSLFYSGATGINLNDLRIAIVR
jgi:glycerate 2-kinase